MAGYLGSAETPGLVAPAPSAVLGECGSRTILPLLPAVQVLPGWSLLRRPQGSGARPGSDVLILHRASTRITPPDGSLQLQGGDGDPGHRNLIARIFYVAQAADGDPHTAALRVKSLSAIAG